MTFATLIRIYGAAGNFDGCLNVYEEMKALGVKPNMTVYNRLLDAMGRARRPSQAKNIYAEMLGNGFQPSWSTYASLFRAYGRARYSEDALKIYKEVKDKGLELSVASGCQPESWTYSSLITIYSCSGKVSEVESTLNEMMEAGFDPNIFVLTSLIQCYGKAGWRDDVVRTFDRMSDLRLSADEQFTGCLLNVLTQTAKENLHKLTICRERANPKLGYVVKLLVDEKKAYCNCLSDICVNLNQLERACELLDVGLTLNIYKDIMPQNATQWSLHLKSLSLGAALTALHIWMNDLNKALESGEEFPSLLGINTGHGKHKYSEKGLAGVFESHLKELNAPFHEAPDHAGWFLTTKVAATSWLESRRAQVVAS
ncbi:Pentatricopeptide repeat-containing protein, chloroplastic [Capsicum annuum]|nr:Pentatricopeptide repeat-containing protein, chloroplastic [Capsicum annuum]